MLAAFDRAEYSLQQPAIVIALALGGATLATVGWLRLRGSGFHTMPRQVATISLMAGIGVAAFGVLLAFIKPPSAVPQASDEPLATLEPIGGDEPLDSSSVISGAVVDAHKEPIEGVTVELVPLFEGRGAKTRDASTDADGAFSFEDVAFDLGSPYVVEAIYEDTRFSTPILRGPRGSDPTAEIVVAAPTKKTDDLSIAVESLAVVGDATAVQVVHALTISNSGERAYVGKLGLPLMRGASAIQEGDGLDRRQLDLEHGGMISSKPILPGKTSVTYSYVTQMSKDGIPFQREVTLPTDRYTLLVAGDLAAKDARGLRPNGEVRLDDTPYGRSVATDLEPGDELSATLVVDPGPDALRIGAPIAAVVIAVLIILIGLLRRRRRTP